MSESTRLTRVGRVVKPARPVWEKAFRDPVLESHIQLRGMTFVERHLARFGLVTLALLLTSTLFSEVWRRGELLPLGEDDLLAFLPTSLLPVTLVTFLVAWALILWGALTASPLIRAAIALTFLLTNAFLTAPTSIEIGDHAALRWGHDVVRAGYYIPAAVLVLSIAFVRLPRVSRWLLPVFRLAVLAGASMFFLGHLWIHLAYVDEGFTSAVPFLVNGSIQETSGLLRPLFYVTAVLVIDFSLDVTEGVAVAARDASRRVARLLLVALLAVKIWVEVVHQRDDWVSYVQNRPMAVVHTFLMMLVLAVAVRLVARFRMTHEFERANERLLYGGAFVWSLIIIGNVVVSSIGIFLVTELGFDELPGFVLGYPVDGFLNYGQPIMAGIALIVGIWMVSTGTENGETRKPLRREVGSGLVVIGAWSLPEVILNAAELNPGFSPKLVDVTVTLGVAVVLAVRWRRITASEAVALTAITVFTWLAMSGGDWLTFLGALLGLPAILIVVFGIAYSLAGDSAFTRVSSKRLPQGSRALMFLGYLILSSTILHWNEVTHSADLSSQLNYAGFFYLGIPWAAWLLGRRLFELDDLIDAIEAEEDAMEAAAARTAPPV